MNDHMMMTAATIPTFSGADPAYTAARWVEDFSDNAEVFGWTPPQKLLIARRVLTGVAGLWLRTEEKFKSFEELQRALLEEFPDKADTSTKHIHELMTDRKKKMAASAKEETRGEQPADVSVKQESDQRQSNGYGCQSEMSAKQPSIMLEVRTDDTNDYLKEKEVTSIKTKENEYEKCQRQTEVVNNKQVLQNKKEKSSKEVPIELKSIKEENIVEHKVEEVSETKIVEEQVEKVEEKVEKVVKKGEFPSLVKKKDGLTRRCGNNKVISEINVMGLLEKEDIQYQDDWIYNKISYNEDEKRTMVLRAMEQEILKRVHENYFSERIMKEEMSKDYHILR